MEPWPTSPTRPKNLHLKLISFPWLAQCKQLQVLQCPAGLGPVLHISHSDRSPLEAKPLEIPAFQANDTHPIFICFTSHFQPDSASDVSISVSQEMLTETNLRLSFSLLHYVSLIATYSLCEFNTATQLSPAPLWTPLFSNWARKGTQEFP